MPGVRARSKSMPGIQHIDELTIVAGNEAGAILTLGLPPVWVGHVEYVENVTLVKRQLVCLHSKNQHRSTSARTAPQQESAPINISTASQQESAPMKFSTAPQQESAPINFSTALQQESAE